jgi:predicted permease
MPQILTILLTTVLPIILIAGLGVLLDRSKKIDTGTLSTVIIYFGSPSLAFYSISTSSISGSEFGALVLFSLLSALAITLVAWLVSLGARMNRLTSSAFVLSAALVNGLNYGVPLNEFAFGQAAVARAILIGTMYALYAFSMGVFLASWGKASIWGAFKNVLIVPLPYAAFLGLAVNLTHAELPPLLLRITQILGGLAIPLMLLMLGIQISRASLHGQWRVMVGASAIRLVGGAGVGLALALLLGLGGVTRQVAIVQAAMPTAVAAGVLATEFNSDAKLVSSITMLSTLLSLISLPIIILFVTNLS